MTCVNTLSAAECHDLPPGDGRTPAKGLAIHPGNQRRAQPYGGKQRSTVRQNRSSPEIAWAAIPTDAAGRTRARFLDCPPADDGRHRHDPGRQFFGPGYHPGDYVFTVVTDDLLIRTRSAQRFDRLAAAAAVPSMAVHHSHATGRRRPENWRESENHQRAHRAKHRRFPVAHRDNTGGRATGNPAATPGWSHNRRSSQPHGPISAKQMV